MDTPFNIFAATMTVLFVAAILGFLLLRRDRAAPGLRLGYGRREDREYGFGDAGVED